MKLGDSFNFIMSLATHPFPAKGSRRHPRSQRSSVSSEASVPAFVVSPCSPGGSGSHGDPHVCASPTLGSKTCTVTASIFYSLIVSRWLPLGGADSVPAFCKPPASLLSSLRLGGLHKLWELWLQDTRPRRAGVGPQHLSQGQGEPAWRAQNDTW